MRYMINVWACRLREVGLIGHVLFARKWAGDWYFRLDHREVGVRADTDFFRMITGGLDRWPSSCIPVVYLDSPYTFTDGEVEQEVRPVIPTEAVKAELIAVLFSLGHTDFTFWEGK